MHHTDNTSTWNHPNSHMMENNVDMREKNKSHDSQTGEVGMGNKIYAVNLCLNPN